MTPGQKQALTNLFNSPELAPALDELRKDLMTAATAEQFDEATRQKNLNMLWGLDALMRKVSANVIIKPKDQAE